MTPIEAPENEHCSLTGNGGLSTYQCRWYYDNVMTETVETSNPVLA